MQKPLKCYMSVVVLLLCTVGILCGSFFDLRISEAVFAPDNLWSKFVEFCGILPTLFIVGSSGMLLFQYYRQKGSKAIAWLLLILITLIAGGFWGYDAFHRYFRDHVILCVLFGVLVMALFDFPLYLLIRNNRNIKDNPKVALLMILSFLFTALFTFGIKFLIARPRYMFLVQWKEKGYIPNVADYYRDWFSFSRDTSMFRGFEGYESFAMQSWPSGHASFSSLTMLSIFLFRFNPKTEDKTDSAFIGSLIWALLVMLARLLDGHHFLSDISFGLLFGFLSFSLFSIWLVPQRRKIVEKE